VCREKIDSILKAPKGMIAAEKKREINNCIYEIQNDGFHLDEKECKYDSARLKIESALKIWEHINDTLNQANLLKYLGYLSGRLRHFALGKTQIAKAINFYKIKKSESGVAVSFYDLSRIYEFENKIDSAINLSYKALLFWRQKNNRDRIVSINNNLINLYLKIAEKKKIPSILSENSHLIAWGNVYWLQEIDFYFLAKQYYAGVKNKKESKEYQALYESKTAAEKDKGQKKYSLYDAGNCR